jgi:hypothetical protein
MKKSVGMVALKWIALLIGLRRTALGRKERFYVGMEAPPDAVSAIQPSITFQKTVILMLYLASYCINITVPYVYITVLYATFIFCFIFSYNMYEFLTVNTTNK